MRRLWPKTFNKHLAELEERKKKTKEDKRDDIVKLVDELMDELDLVEPIQEEWNHD